MSSTKKTYNRKRVDNYQTYLDSYYDKKARVEKAGFTVPFMPMNRNEYEAALEIAKKEQRASYGRAEGSSKIAAKLASQDVYTYSDKAIKGWQKALESVGSKHQIKANIATRMQGLPEQLISDIQKYRDQYAKSNPGKKSKDVAEEVSRVFFGSN